MKKIAISFIFLFLTLNIYCLSIEKDTIEPLTKYAETIDINKIFKQKNKKLIFITTWCSYCKKEIEKIEQTKIENDYIYIFGNYGSDDIKKVSKFLESHPNLKYVFFDKNNILKKKFNIKTVPYKLVL